MRAPVIPSLRRTNRLAAPRGALRPITIVVAIAIWTAGLGAGSAGPASAATIRPAATVTTTTTTLAGDVAWIRSAQLADGAIATYPDKTFVSPYQANFAALGLARAYAVGRDPAAAQSAWRWLAWYAGHMNPAGFVTDYRVTNGVASTTGDMDSTDAYAGTYLLALYETYRATGNRAQLATVAPSVARAVGAIEATQDADGLTWAKPAWHVKYLMDQAETYAGLQAANLLAGVLGDAALGQRAAADAARMRSGVDRLWNAATGAYNWAVHSDGTQIATDWSRLYPDALQQAWAVGFGLVDAARSSALMGTFTRTHPRWAQPTALDNVNGSTGPVGSWPPVGWALVRVGRTADATQAATSIRQAAVAAGRPWPFSTAIQGQLVVLDSGTLPSAIPAR